MAKTKKVKQRRNLRKKQRSRRFGRGKEQMVPVALSKMLSKVSEDTYGQEFHDNGRPSVVTKILSYLPIESVIEAIEVKENAPLKKEVTDLISQRLNQSAKFAKFINYDIANEISNTIPTTHWTSARQKAEKAEYKRRLEKALILNKKILSHQKALIKQLKMSGVDGPARGTRSSGSHTRDPVLEDLELEAYHTGRAIMQITGILSHVKNNPTYLPYGFTNYGDTLRERPGWDMPRMTYTARFRPPGYPNWK